MAKLCCMVNPEIFMGYRVYCEICGPICSTESLTISPGHATTVCIHCKRPAKFPGIMWEYGKNKAKELDDKYRKKFRLRR